MIQWEYPAPKPKPVPHEAVISHGDLRLYVKPSDSKQWQGLVLSFGKLSEKHHEECLETWPRVAINYARAALDDFEAALNEDKEVT